ncbi:MAG: hypothetical protein IID52_02875 [Proteobacteria bacterium]|nr:hypothetical protein [Pseudomonadota bacterium]
MLLQKDICGKLLERCFFEETLLVKRSNSMTNSGSNRKPTGKIGPITINLEDKTAEFQPLQFPKGKAKIEEFIFKFFIKGLGKAGRTFYKIVSYPTQNQENDFDFTLETEFGDEYLDLMEVAPLEKIGGSYEAASSSYNHGEMADWVWSKLISKSKKYGSASTPHIHLLLYSTDWRFRLSEGVIRLLAFWAITREHCFKTIIYFVPDDATHDEAKIISPCDHDLFKGYDEEAARSRKSLIGNPEKIRQEGNGSFSIPLGKNSQIS